MRPAVRVLVPEERPPELVDQILLSAGPVPRRLIVVLGESLVQRRRLVDLPPVNRSTALRIVRRNSGRYFRTRSGGLEVDMVADRSRPRHSVWLAAAAPTLVIDTILTSAARLGYEVVSVQPDHRSGWPDLSLIPSAELKRRATRHWRNTARVGVLVVVVSLLIWIASFMGRLRTVQHSDARLEAADSIVAAVRDVSAAYHELNAVTTTMQQAESSRRQVGRLVASLVGALPDSAVLMSLAIDSSGNVRLSGYADEALSVVAALQHIPGLVQLQLEGAPIREASGGRHWMRFALRSVPK